MPTITLIDLSLFELQDTVDICYAQSLLMIPIISCYTNWLKQQIFYDVL